MRCRRICRELLWLARFGEFGPSSQPHLEHLAACRACRDEVGFDRAMVEQLRIALAARIDGATPSPSAWDRILARAQDPEPRVGERLWGWSTSMVSRLRFATAMAGTGLALILALNTQIVPLGLPASDADGQRGEPSALERVPRVPPPQSALAALLEQWGGAGDGASRPDPEAVMALAGRVPQADSGATAPVAQPQLRISFQSTQTPEPEPAGAIASIQSEGASSSPSGSEPGVPS